MAVATIERIGSYQGNTEITTSADGNYVAYLQFGTLTAANGQTVGGSLVYLRDMSTGTTTLVTPLGVDRAGVPQPSESSFLSLSDDGRYLAFVSNSVTLPPVIDLARTNISFRVFVYDRVTGSMIVASGPSSTTDADDDSAHPRISGDGRHITFASRAGNLTPDSTKGLLSVYTRDLDLGQTVLVSRSLDGSPANGQSQWPVLNRDGSKVAFTSEATNLIGTGTSPSFYQVYVRDLNTATTTQESVFSTGQQIGGDVAAPSIDDTGNHLVFNALDPQGGFRGVYIRDLASRTTQTVLTASAQGRISPDGQFVVFVTDLPVLTTDTNLAKDVYLWNSLTGSMLRVTEAADGGQFFDNPQHLGQHLGLGPVVDAGGQHVVFTSVEPYDVLPFAAVPVDGGYPTLLFRSKIQPDSAPDAPTAVAASPGDGSATVTWVAPAHTGGPPIISYTATAQPGSETCSVSDPSTGCTITGLTNGTTYAVSVTATNVVGTGSASTPVPVTPIGAAVPQVITFTQPPPGTYGSSAALTATGGGSGNPVTFSVAATSDPGVCSISAATVSFTGAGNCAVTASQDGNASYLPATPVTVTIPAAKAALTITASDVSQAFGATSAPAVTPVYAGFVASDTAATALTTPPTCTAALTATTPVGTYPGATSCTGALAANYTIAYVNGRATVTASSQTIAFSPPAQVAINTTGTLSATGGASGNPVVFSLDPTSGTGVCSLSGTNRATIRYSAVGNCVIDANQAGNATYAPAPQVTATIAVRRPQTITFAAIGNKTMLQSPLTVTATASSGLPVTFATTTPATCTASGANGGTITFVTAGTCTITATQPGNNTYLAAAPVTRTFTVTKAAQVITFSAIGSKTMLQSPLTVAATASSGLPVTLATTAPATCTASGANGGTITLVAAGTCTIVASQPGDNTYQAANSVTRTFNVTKATQTITFAPLTAKPLASSPVTLTATASSGLPVSFISTTPAVCTAGGANGATITLLTTGTCSIVATQPGDQIYQAAPNVTRNFRVT